MAEHTAHSLSRSRSDGSGGGAVDDPDEQSSMVLHSVPGAQALRRRMQQRKHFRISEYTQQAKQRMVITAGRHSSPSVPTGVAISRSTSF